MKISFDYFISKISSIATKPYSVIIKDFFYPIINIKFSYSSTLFLTDIFENVISGPLYLQNEHFPNMQSLITLEAYVLGVLRKFPFSYAYFFHFTKSLLMIVEEEIGSTCLKLYLYLKNHFADFFIQKPLKLKFSIQFSL